MLEEKNPENITKKQKQQQKIYLKKEGVINNIKCHQEFERTENWLFDVARWKSLLTLTKEFQWSDKDKND